MQKETFILSHRVSVGREFGNQLSWVILAQSFSCNISLWAGGALEAALSGNSLALKANPEINTISEMSYRTSWQCITEIQECIKAFITLVAGNQLEGFRELQSHIIVLSLGT